MANQRILATEEMVGDGHATKADTLNRHGMVEHAEDGSHLNSYGSLYEYTPAGNITSITTGGTFVKWAYSTAGEVTGGDFITSDTGTDSFTIGTDGTGIYDAFFSASVQGEANLAITLAIFIDGVREDRLTRTTRLGKSHVHFPDSVDLKIGSLVSGDVDTMVSQDATYYDITETATPTGFIIDLTFVGVTAPLFIDFTGRYSGNAGDDVECQILDASVGADEVQDGGNGYTCIRSHTSGASTQPGTGADWTSYWELKGAAAGEDAWVTATGYDDSFDEVRSATKDLPYSASADYTRSWEVAGTHIDRTKYSDASNECHVRFIHTTSGNATHHNFIDSISIQDDHSAASITLKDFIPLAATEEIDARITTNQDSSQVITSNVNFNLNRIKQS